MRIPMIRMGLVVVVLVLLLCARVHAGYFDAEDSGLGPIQSRSVIPIYYLFYAMPAQRAETIGRNKVEFNTHFDLSSDFERATNGPNSVGYDMELYRTSFNLRYGILENVDLHLEIPIIAFGNGFLDGFINSYHSAFGFPDNGRKNFPDDQYAYMVTYNNQVMLAYPSHGLMLSDVNLDLKWMVLKDEAWWPAVSLRAGVKFPTGKFSHGGGSGKFDYAFGFAISKSISRLHTFAGFDVVIIQDPRQLSQFIDSEIYEYFAGLEFALIRHYLSLVVQIEGHNQIFVRTGLAQLDHHVLDIVPGFKGEVIKDHLEWQVALREDLIPHSTVDFTASLGLTAKF